jgi:hypothetical protein
MQPYPRATNRHRGRTKVDLQLLARRCFKPQAGARLGLQRFVKVIERPAEQPFELLAWPECTPLGMGEVGSRLSKAREGDDAAVLVVDGGYALSPYRATCHGPSMYASPVSKRN